MQDGNAVEKKVKREFKTLMSSEFPIAGKDWPSSWPTHTIENDLVELEKVICKMGML